MKKYIIFDLDGTLIKSMGNVFDVITDFLVKNVKNSDENKIKYILNNTSGTPLLKQIEIIYFGEDINYQEITNNIYEDLMKIESEFFSGVPEKILELSNRYKLFLTTGNSTKVAEKHLEEAKILDNFELVLGSNIFLKGNEHLEIFEEYSNDTNFYKNAVYVGDGNSDRDFAMGKNIDFIHIGNDKIDKYEISSVVEIDSILINL